MVVGQNAAGSVKGRPEIEEGKLLGLFQNLAFCWVIYHSHTFSNISLANYFKLKPGMLTQELEAEESSWKNIS